MSSATPESSLSRAADVIGGLWRSALANLAKRWIAQIMSEWEIRRGVDVLIALDDRALADIGLSRGAVEYAARHGWLPMQTSNEGCPEIRPAADKCPTDRIPSVGTERHAAARPLLIAHGIFAACVIALKESQAQPDTALGPGAATEPIGRRALLGRPAKC